MIFVSYYFRQWYQINLQNKEVQIKEKKDEKTLILDSFQPHGRWVLEIRKNFISCFPCVLDFQNAHPEYLKLSLVTGDCCQISFGSISDSSESISSKEIILSMVERKMKRQWFDPNIDPNLDPNPGQDNPCLNSPNTHWRCKNGNCLLKSSVCDGSYDCSSDGSDNSDEESGEGQGCNLYPGLCRYFQ